MSGGPIYWGRCPLCGNSFTLVRKGSGGVRVVDEGIELVRQMSALDELLSTLRVQAREGHVHTIHEVVGLLLPLDPAALADHCAMLAVTAAILIQREVYDRVSR